MLPKLSSATKPFPAMEGETALFASAALWGAAFEEELCWNAGVDEATGWPES